MLAMCTKGAGDNGDCANREADHGDHQQEYYLGGEAQGGERVLCIWQAPAHGSVNGEGEDVEKVEPDNRRRQVEQSPPNGALWCRAHIVPDRAAMGARPRRPLAVERPQRKR